MQIEQAEPLQQLEGIILRHKMTTQASPRGIADSQLLAQGGIAQSTLLKIMQRLRVGIELRLIKSRGLLERVGPFGG